ncbi:MAG: MaoC/PaaZ C-terminal domain-containing protein [Proteobacteria bacterium]|nr:MaoC/PaaZ C-terminal domain-containing protein [Pseudomonadota bacterium]MCZ6784255.1 MaoC/PaaZ C-terminal domain-containing protein [Pseudomonadota bacterium]
MTRAFASVELGDDLPEVQPDVSMENVRLFCASARMPFGRFTDHEKARAEGLPGAIVPGIMSQALLSALVHRWSPGCRIENMDTIFRAPVLVDSKPTCRGVVTNTDPESETIELDLTIVNEAGETRVVGTAQVRL